MTTQQALITTGEIWRCYKLAKNTMSMVKGIGAGIATGVVVGYMGSKLMKTSPKRIKKRAGKAMHAMGDLVEGVSYMFK